ncbi:PREDICTED: uncharacterized protein LOC109127397 [Camelina sativa]|uniref:Uncharacterized protein LOC109127397 n=1 Tax=Camelina sativa TaxID=90675 RepID=A0ABM1QLD9_CAMSA|nr:PREDICTED: uncharacterized protein LOC109127397 [Camelina sativa]
MKITKDIGTLLPDSTQYKKFVGKLMYLQITIPDIYFVVNKLCQYSHDPRDTHLLAVHEVLRYLKGTVGQGFFYPADNKFDLRAFSDANWGTCTDDSSDNTTVLHIANNSVFYERSKLVDLDF